ncbi:hypothetical protein BC936DRAFT_142333 [Jimgerdemannia flammicorona]|uniref:FAD dependent oxidoreductase domain-containing protein n=1 Tax=Jimgerdemannia flammicorona TaxID=994334 RepID=A0A433DFB3_9FUNG|nr:hypothetical protein BC936DRAFT_142333 [Jimgerdemannia flammicorona]
MQPPSTNSHNQREHVYIYLNWLRYSFVTQGGNISRRTLRHFREAANVPTPDVIVNCLGIAARDLVDDRAVYPIRGHTVLVHAPHVKIAISRLGKDVTYIIPRENGDVILGGTMESDNSDPTVDLSTSIAILDRCEALYSGLRKGMVYKTSQVGFRPARKGGVRVETEVLGYQTSWGSSNRVVELIEQEWVQLENKARL